MRLKTHKFDYFDYHFNQDKTEEHITWNRSDYTYNSEFCFSKDRLGDLSKRLGSFICRQRYYDNNKYYKLNGIVYTLGCNENPPLGAKLYQISNEIKLIFIAGEIYLCAQQDNGAWSLFNPNHDVVNRYSNYGDIKLAENLYLCHGYKTNALDSFAKKNFAPVFELFFSRGKDKVEAREKVPNLLGYGFADAIPSLQMYEKIVYYIRNVICNAELQKLSDDSLRKKHGFDGKSFKHR